MVKPSPLRTAVIDAGGPVHYADYGGDGEPMVVVHGLGGNHLNCGLIAPYLTDQFHVFAPDLIGFGLTPLAGRRSSMLNNRLLVGNFVAQVIGGPATLVGHSMGGAISMLLAAADPSMVARLVLIDAAVGDVRTTLSPPLTTPVLQAMSRVPGPSAALIRATVRASPELATRRGLGRAVRDPDTLDAEMVDAHVAMERLRCRNPGAYLGLMQAWRSMQDVVADIDEFFDVVVSRVVAPTLLLQGAGDPVVAGDFARRAPRLRPDWRVEVLVGRGHSPHMERPDEVAEKVLEWVRGAAPVATPR